MKNHVNFLYKVKENEENDLFRNRGSYERATNFKAIARLRNLRKSTFEKISQSKRKAKFSFRDLPYNYELFLH